MQTTDFGPAFFHVIRVENAPLLHTAPTIEVEPPFRRSTSLIVRVPVIPRIPLLKRLPLMDRALVLGWWRKADWDDPDEALMAAVQGWGCDPYDESMEDEEVRQTIRENIAKTVLDPSDEWEIVQALGVDE